MVEHNSQYFISALQDLDWSRGFTGNQLMNIFFDFPIGWFVHVPKDRRFHTWQEFWLYVTPISASTVGPQVHQRDAERYLQELPHQETSSQRAAG